MYKISNRDDIKRYAGNVFRNGLPKGVSTGIPTLDPHYKYRKGELDVIMGLANIGKTTTMFYLMLNASMRYGWKWLCYCPENEPVGDMISDIAEMFVGKSADKDRADRMSSTEFSTAIDWVLQHFTIITFEEQPTATQVLDAFEEQMEVVKYDGCLIDPLNDLKVESGFSKYDYYYNMLSSIRRFKQKHNVKFILTTHAGTAAARKRDDKGRIPAPSMYDVEFGGMFANRTDNFIVIHRHLNSEQWDITEIHVRKIKFQKLVGLPTQDDSPVSLKFSPKNCRFAYLNYSNGGNFIDPMDELKIKPNEDELEF
tara:strand:+ start:1512 stop:2447 length:936 start_codon:yes stop_codon:yes gene_type:complete